MASRHWCDPVLCLGAVVIHGLALTQRRLDPAWRAVCGYAASPGARLAARLARLCALLALWLTFVLPAAAWASTAPAEVDAPGVQRLVDAEVLEAGTSYPEQTPAADAPWQPLRLPDNWAGTRPGYSGYLWYRLKFDGPTSADTAVYLPGYSMNLRLWVNGVALGGVGRLREPVSRYAYAPRLSAIAASLLRPGPAANELLVLVAGYPMLRCGVSEIYLGPAEALQAAHDQRLFWQVTGLQISIVVSLMLGLYVAMLWWRERGNAVFGWFALAASIWGLRNLNLVVHEPPWHALLGNVAWSRLFACGEVLFIATFAMFTWRYTEELSPRDTVAEGRTPVRWPGRVAAAYVACGLLAMLAMPADPASWRYLMPLSLWGLAMTLWTQARLSITAWRVRRTEPVAIAVAGFVYLLLLAHDTALIADTQQQGLYHLRPYAVLPLFGAIGWLLTQRYLDALRATHLMAKRLSTEVQNQRVELQGNFDRLREAERAQTQAQERSRLMRDLHDGLGLHLLSALQQTRAPGADLTLLAGTLQDCMDELRVAVDSLAGDERDPAAVLGNLRYRMAPRLAAAGIRLDWVVDGDIPELAWLDAPHVLQLLRLVQEALTNAVRHSGAKVVTITLRRQADALDVCVFDDGQGTGQGAGLVERNGGHGLANMRARAEALGASLTLSSSPLGSCIVLGLPLTR